MQYKRIFITGDKHGEFFEVADFCRIYNTNKDDLLIILGDVGLNYHLNEIDDKRKKELNDLPITVLCIHGNHEERPEKIDTYHKVNWCDGFVYQEKRYPSLLFGVDGENYCINQRQFLVLGGAYSIDKTIRLIRGWKWFESEQPSEAFKTEFINHLQDYKDYDIVLSHTCPYSMMPRDLFIKGLPETMIDYATEDFLETVYNTISFNKWYFGHYHDDRIIDDKFSLLFHDFIQID